MVQQDQIYTLGTRFESFAYVAISQETEPPSLLSITVQSGQMELLGASKEVRKSLQN